MSNTTANPAADASAIFDSAPATAAKAGFEPHLSFYHASPSGKGAAVRFSITPATGDQDGAVYFSIAQQLTTGSPATATEPKRFASFDWRGKVTVKLNVIEVSELLFVIAGAAPALVHAGKNGLFHNSPTATTTIEFKRSEDPARPGFLLGVGRTPKADSSSRQYIGMSISVPEAYALRLALEQSMGLLAFGIPHSRASSDGGRTGVRPTVPAMPPPAPAMPGLENPSVPVAAYGEAV